MESGDLKRNLGYVCKTKNGYVNELINYVGKKEIVLQFESVGFITKGHTLKKETWKKTNLADQYYKDLFGRLSYLFL